MSLGTWWTDLRKKPDLEEKDHLIAVIGVTGAGKSTFINRAIGRDDLQTSDSQHSCTTDITPCTYKQNGRKVTLFDTPGFDDTHRSDADILELISNFLGGIGDEGMLLSGIIFLQPISGVRVQGSEKRRTRLIEAILGKDCFPRVILATTQWNKLKNKKEGLAKVAKCKAEKEFWGDMVEHGARVVNHEDNKTSARKIVGMILDMQTPPVPLQLQVELAMNQFAVASTTAGLHVMKELDKSTSNLVGKLNLVRHKQSETVNDHGSQLQDEVNELNDHIGKNAKEREKLKSVKVDPEQVSKWLDVIRKAGYVTLKAGEIMLCAMS